MPELYLNKATTKAHIILAHKYFKEFLSIGDIAIDATCGNGYDSFQIAKLIFPCDITTPCSAVDTPNTDTTDVTDIAISNWNITNGFLYCLDIQDSAIKKTKALLNKNFSKLTFEKKIKIQKICHSQIDKIFYVEEISNNSHKAKPQNIVNLINYNLGYLPGGDKSITTTLETTLLSIRKGLSMLAEKGAMSIMFYPGHSEGKKEETEILQEMSLLPTNIWEICHHKWINYKNGPSFLWIRKKQKN